jgi:DNA-binding MarR family transcriptional regulator
MSTGHQIAMSLRAAYLAMHRQSDASLAGKEGVTADQFVVLAVLVEEDRITQQTLVRRTSSDPNTIGAMLALMERRRLIVRERHPTDGRARSVVLTKTGRQTFARLLTRSECVRQNLERLFRPDEARMLTEFLGRIAAQLGATTEHGYRRGPRKRGPVGDPVERAGSGIRSRS